MVEINKDSKPIFPILSASISSLDYNGVTTSPQLILDAYSKSVPINVYFPNLSTTNSPYPDTTDVLWNKQQPIFIFLGIFSPVIEDSSTSIGPWEDIITPSAYKILPG